MDSMVSRDSNVSMLEYVEGGFRKGWIPIMMLYYAHGIVRVILDPASWSHQEERGAFDQPSISESDDDATGLRKQVAATSRRVKRRSERARRSEWGREVEILRRIERFACVWPVSGCRLLRAAGGLMGTSGGGLLVGWAGRLNGHASGGAGGSTRKAREASRAANETAAGAGERVRGDFDQHDQSDGARRRWRREGGTEQQRECSIV